MILKHGHENTLKSSYSLMVHQKETQDKEQGGGINPRVVIGAYESVRVNNRINDQLL